MKKSESESGEVKRNEIMIILEEMKETRLLNRRIGNDEKKGFDGGNKQAVWRDKLPLGTAVKIL